MAKYSCRELKPTRFGFGEALKYLGTKHPEMVVLGADISNSVCVNYFSESFPDRFFSVGIAEQNMMAVAAGMAMEGKIPFVATYAVFAALRAMDQIRVSVCYNNVPVKIGGAHAGISVGPDGATHQALEDIAMIRVLPNITLLSPCDAAQTYLATIAAVEQVPGPVYIRFGREAVPDFTDIKSEFRVGKGQIMKEGNDVTVFATGHMVWEALLSADILEKEGVNVRVINMHTIKPLDEEIIQKAALETGALVTAEEHQVAGGFGSAVAEVLVKHKPVPVEFVGMNNSFGESGTPTELMQKYGMTSGHIAEACRKVLLRK